MWLIAYIFYWFWEYLAITLPSSGRNNHWCLDPHTVVIIVLSVAAKPTVIGDTPAKPELLPKYQEFCDMFNHEEANTLPATPHIAHKIVPLI